MNIAALIPTLHRPDGLLKALNSIRETARDVHIVIAADADDEIAARTAALFGATLAICKQSRMGCAYAWNTALEAYPDADIYVIGSDDAIFQPGWLEAALKALAKIDGSGLVGFHSGEKDELALHYMMTRDFLIEHHGGVAAVPHYSSWCVDTEAVERARRARKYIKAMDALVLHEWGGPDGDECYRLGAERRDENKALYYKRKKLGFPDDFEPILRKQDE